MFCFVLFLLFVFFLTIQSQAVFVNCLYVARFTIVHSKTQIKFPLLSLSLLSLISLLQMCEIFKFLYELCVFSDECSTFLDMMNNIGIDKKQQLYIIKKMISISITATYYIVFCINRKWDSQDLMQFWFCLFCLFVLLLLLLNNQSQAAFVNYLCGARFTILYIQKHKYSFHY